MKKLRHCHPMYKKTIWRCSDVVKVGGCSNCPPLELLKSSQCQALFEFSTRIVKPRLHDTTCCQTGCQTGLTTGKMFVYTIQPVVKPVVKPGCTTGLTTVLNEQPVHSTRLSNSNRVCQPVERTVAVRSTRLSNRLSKPFDSRFDNRLYRVYEHSIGCQTGLTTGCIV